jgi:predicted  nucleic acid-binding Zn-ribbon protein
MTSINELYAFQELDLELQAAKDELEEVQSQLGETDALVEARTNVANGTKAVAEAEHDFKERESDSDDLQVKIDPVQEKLYKGTVTNPKELADLQLDLDSLRRRKSELEDRAFAAMDVLDAAQKVLSDAEAAYSDVEKEYGSDQAELVDRKVSLTEQIATLESERAEEIVEIDEELLELYNQLAPNKQGRAVAKLDSGMCGGCRITLPTNVMQRVRSSSEIVRCSSCERILFVG